MSLLSPVVTDVVADPTDVASGGPPSKTPTVTASTSASGPTTASASRPAATGRWWPSRWRLAVLATLAVLFLVVGLVQAGRDAPTVDEGVELSAGVTSLARHDLRLNPEHPPLPKLLAALPALIAHPVIPDTPAYRSGAWFDYSAEFVQANQSAGRLHELVLLGRLVPLLECLACALCLFALGSRLLGADAGLVAAAVWLTLPPVVGIGHLAQIDVPFTLAALAVSLALLSVLERPGLRPTLALGLAVGGALCVRQTAVVLAVVALVVVAMVERHDRQRLAKALLVLLAVPLAVTWATYRLVDPSGPRGAVAARFEGIDSAAAQRSPEARLLTALPLPLEWRAGAGFLAISDGRRPSYLLGQAWDGGRWWFFPASILVKVPTATLVLLVLGPWWLLGLDRVRRRRLLVAVVVPAAALLLAVAVEPFSRGVRLVLPSLALWLVAAAAVARAGRARWVRVAAIVLAGAQLAAFVGSSPHSLAYTAAPFQPGYRWASGSNVDFGQDLGLLERWARGRHPYVAYALTRGLALPAGTRPLVGTDPRRITGWVAVGATALTQEHRSELSWLRAYCPVGDLGGSILLYRFDRPPDLRPGPTQPAAPCTDARTSTRSVP